MLIKDLKVGKLYEMKFGYDTSIQMLTDIEIKPGPHKAASCLYRFYFLHGKDTKILEYRTFTSSPENCDIRHVVKEHL